MKNNSLKLKNKMDYSLEHVRTLIPSYNDFPKKGVVFYDIHPIMQNAEARTFLVNQLAERYKDEKVDIIVGLESRGYYLGILLAQKMSLPFVPLRKAGKLPGEVISHKYNLEYGNDAIEVQKSAVPSGSRVVIVDDLLATGGTAVAAITLVNKCGGIIVEFHVHIELVALKGQEKLPNDVKFYSFFQL